MWYHTSTESCTIICNTTNACRQATIHCNPNTECTVICEGSWACADIEYKPYYDGQIKSIGVALVTERVII